MEIFLSLRARIAYSREPELEQSCGFAIAAWSHEEVALKLPGEVRLIRKAGFMGHIAHFVPLRQQRFGTRQAQLDLIGMGRQADLLAEGTRQMKRTHVDHPGQ